MPTNTRAMLFSTEPEDQEEQITFTPTKLEFDFQGDPRGEILKEIFQSGSSPSPAKCEIWPCSKNCLSCFSCTLSQAPPPTAPLSFLQTWAHFYPSAKLLTEEGLPRKMQKSKTVTADQTCILTMPSAAVTNTYLSLKNSASA